MSIIVLVLSLILGSVADAAIQTINGFVQFPDMWTLGFTTGTTVCTMDQNDERCAYVFRAPKTGTMTDVAFRVSTVLTSGTVDVRLETVADNGTPSGTLQATGTNASLSLSTTGWKEVTLGTAASVTAGDYLAVVVDNPATGSGSFTIDRANRSLRLQGLWILPYIAFFSNPGPAWTKGQVSPVGYVVYSDDTVPPFGNSPYITTGQTVSDSQNVDEFGNLVTIPMTARVSGVWATGNLSGSNSVVIRLYDTDGTTVLTSETINASQIGGAGTNRAFFVKFTSPQTLSGGVSYRVVYAVTGTNSFAAVYLTFPSAEVVAGLTFGADLVRTQRLDGGAWTQTANDRVAIGVLVDGFDDGT